ncbi:succinylglutamate desuccinylase/aspartoacylase family protein [Colwellia sp. 6M3]|jgi:predicted deacylase|uniref:succinylglutamate desuccinylase/aspartoacylase family protein n=1 Tax=Colwellia sp. 6M3 TaxID=2759849 RepID=UPI0015F39187|nr:succinylglutamate desuccinylase/aspartoacylase family protein [Colwellia sp. 6M3]MBA6414642.1 succinylglutamate desuccinylase/aspartoacylase family protein [Colwellia sp. 6M3]|tara:strand:- start:886 stop:2034 length:1149 start_codon:yes stop_codon:yes gene_type:complete
MNLISKEVMHVGEMASGATLTVPVYRIKGNGQGPNVYIQANMHGAEVQGNAVIFQLLEQLKHIELNGSITLVPYANPVGCNHKNGEYTLGRFDPITGENWNRMYHFDESIIEPFAKAHLNQSNAEIAQAFQALMVKQLSQKLNHNVYGITTGQRIAYQLQLLALEADLVLDLHTGPISSKHLYCPDYARPSAEYFDIPHVLFIPNGFDGALDEATFCPWWYLQLKFAELGRDFPITKTDENQGENAVIKESFTVELGSQEQIDLDVAHEDALGILSYLQYQGAINSQQYQPKTMTRYSCLLKDYKALYSPMGGMVDYLAEFGKPLPAGEPLARILRMDNYGDGDPLHYINFDHSVIPILHFASASVNQGTELYKVFSKYTIL